MWFWTSPRAEIHQMDRIIWKLQVFPKQTSWNAKIWGIFGDFLGIFVTLFGVFGGFGCLRTLVWVNEVMELLWLLQCFRSFNSCCCCQKSPVCRDDSPSEGYAGLRWTMAEPFPAVIEQFPMENHHCLILMGKVSSMFHSKISKDYHMPKGIPCGNQTWLAGKFRNWMDVPS